jgi:SnoaL-like domain
MWSEDETNNMTPEQEMVIAYRLERLETDYWYDVDTNWGAAAHDFYVEDGIFDMGLGSKPHAGRAAVQHFYAWRRNRGTRTARHVISNFQVRVKNAREATSLCIMSLYAADGEPILPSKPPIMIADVESECVRGDDGVWRFRRRTLKPVFIGGEAPTIMTEK